VGRQTFDVFGKSVNLSSDSRFLAVGAEQHDTDTDFDAGSVRIFRRSETEWIQIGDDFVGDSYMDNLGGSLAMSQDGFTVAAGADLHDQPENNAGLVRVFQRV